MYKYTCPLCNVTNDEHSWNNQTTIACNNENIEPISGIRDGAFYFCPNCKEEVDGLQVIEEAK